MFFRFSEAAETFHIFTDCFNIQFSAMVPKRTPSKGKGPRILLPRQRTSGAHKQLVTAGQQFEQFKKYLKEKLQTWRWRSPGLHQNEIQLEWPIFHCGGLLLTCVSSVSFSLVSFSSERDVLSDFSLAWKKQRNLYRSAPRGLVTNNNVLSTLRIFYNYFVFTE